MEKKNIIWSNYPGADYSGADEELLELDLYDLMRFNNRPGDYIALANIGRWNGRINGYREVQNARNCFNFMEDYAEFYLDAHNNFRCRTAHHDGTNYILFREWKDDLSDVQRENFLQKWCSGRATGRDVCRYTKSVGSRIKTIY